MSSHQIWLRDELSQQNVSVQSPTINSSIVRLYCCGPTVYDYVHIGNARPLIITDLLVRLLRFYQYRVDYCQNITDIDDKIIDAAQKAELSETKYVQPYITDYYQQCARLNLTAPTKTILVSDTIEQQIALIQQLLAQKDAYLVENEVFFAISHFLNPQKNQYYYYQLSRFNANQMRPRIQQITAQKHDPRDFYLWKKTKLGIQFVAPWGSGRPGWHTECATIVGEHFQGRTIDVHVGGHDLKFPHHENERIQFIARFQKPLARIWFYVGQLQLQGQKMSKSQQNFIYLKEFLNDYSTNLLKYLFYNSHYRHHLNLTDQLLREATVFVKKINRCYQALIRYTVDHDLLAQSDHELLKACLQPLHHNLNTRSTLTVFYRLLKNIHQQISQQVLTCGLLNTFLVVTEDILGFVPPMAHTLR